MSGSRMSEAEAEIKQKEGEEKIKEYKTLLEKVSELELGETTSPVTGQLIDISHEANVLFHASNADNIILPSTDECLSEAIDCTVKTTEVAKPVVHTYDYREFANRIRSKYYDEDEGRRSGNPYKKLMPFVNSLIKRVPNYVTYYGPAGVVTAEPHASNEERKTKQRNEHSKNKKPAVKSTEAVEEETTEEHVRFMWWALNNAYEENQNNRINYYQLVLNPKSFSNSVENIFHVSFLVSEGKVRLERDEVHNLWISPVSSKAANMGCKPKKQAIISLDWNRWEQLCQKLKLEEPFLEKWKVRWEEDKKKFWAVD